MSWGVTEIGGVVTAIMALVNLFFGALNAWQNKSIEGSILKLKLDLSNRIATSEGDIKALQMAAAYYQGRSAGLPPNIISNRRDT
jgi:hypothetical protein